MSDNGAIQSLLLDPLHVPLPSHISLSAPLVLRTETKDDFLDFITTALRSARTRVATSASNAKVQPKDGVLLVKPTKLTWHPNHDRTRTFLVLRVKEVEGLEGRLKELLTACNGVAREFGCHELYANHGRRRKANSEKGAEEEEEDVEGFHISLAWSLDVEQMMNDGDMLTDSVLEAKMQKIREMEIPFSEVKIRLGKDVTTVPLGRTQRRRSGILG